jgi:hypothetical protein
MINFPRASLAFHSSIAAAPQPFHLEAPHPTADATLGRGLA